ncbi:MAG: radical SAM protein [Planctomycetes bacterium]|nr:radical SAM protein [Planctomycetota bacterium]
MAKRVLLETDKRLLLKFAWIMGVKGFLSMRRHRARMARGEFFPPFLYVSVINSCNLRCQGCWVDVGAKQQKIDAPALNRLIRDAKAMGNCFFGILGGEPFLHDELLDVVGAHRDCYFQVFTNGHFVTDAVASELRKFGNVTPLISIEGSEIVSDVRRGRAKVYGKTMEGLENCLRHRLLTGVCTSLCRSNIEDLLREEWIDQLIDMGVMYAWYHIYRPVGPDACPELALTADQQLAAREFVVRMRSRKPIAMIDAYYDGKGNALCPAATGFTHHISPWGDIEPCPVIQFAKDSIHDARPLSETIRQSAFLRDFRETAAGATRGCIVLERPDLLIELMDKHAARDSTARKTMREELAAMRPHPSQFHPGHAIPERAWFYRFVKFLAFRDFGMYARRFRIENWRKTEAEEPIGARCDAPAPRGSEATVSWP